MRRALVILTLCALPLTARGASDREVRAVRARLLQIDAAPDKEALVAASPEAASILREIAGDTRAARPLRGRALAALAFFPSSETKATLRHLLRSRRAPELLRSRALMAMSAAFEDASVSEVAAYLSDRSEVLQDTAAQALGALGTPKAKATLRQALRRSTDPELSRRIRAALRPTRRGAP